MKAFLVVGAEGSGTYMLWEALASAGCGVDIEKNPENYAARRSLPHAGEWPDIVGWVWDVVKRNYEPYPIFILRDWYCTVRSITWRDASRDWEETEKNMVRAFATMGAIAAEYHNSTYVTYEAFCLSEGFRRWLFKTKLCLPEPTIEINFANEKWYE